MLKEVHKYGHLSRGNMHGEISKYPFLLQCYPEKKYIFCIVSSSSQCPCPPFHVFARKDVVCQFYIRGANLLCYFYVYGHAKQ